MKYKKYIDDIVLENPFKSSLFTDQLKKNILRLAQNDILRTFQYTEKMGTLILEEIVTRFINSYYDVCALSVKS